MSNTREILFDILKIDCSADEEYILSELQRMPAKEILKANIQLNLVIYI